MNQPIQLFCLPYAGSSASGYVRWRRRLPAWVEVAPVELPGRGRRMREPLEESVPALLARIEGDVRPRPGQPFAIFGHSLGAMLAFELAARLEARGTPPALLFVSGTRSPSTRDPERFAGLDTDQELRAELARLDGTPQSILAEPELMQMVLPVLRADFRVARSYAPDPALAIAAPLVALGGSEDEGTRGHLQAWRPHTRGEFALHELAGGHFYIHGAEAELLAIIEQHLRLVIEPARRSGRPPAGRESARAEGRE